MARTKTGLILAERFQGAEFVRGGLPLSLSDEDNPRHLGHQCGFDDKAPIIAGDWPQTISVKWKQASLRAIAHLVNQAELRSRQFLRIKVLADDVERLENVLNSHEVRINALAASVRPYSTCDNISEFIESLGIEDVFEDIVTMTRNVFRVDPNCSLENDVDTPGRQYVVLEVTIDVDVDAALEKHEEWHRRLVSKFACLSVFSLAIDIANES